MKKKFIVIMCLLLIIVVPNAIAGRLVDTGQTDCYGQDNIIVCPQTGEPFYGQDSHYQGFQHSYTKFDVIGVELPDDATEWPIVKDNVTGLFWEVKQHGDGFPNYSNPHNAYNIYSLSELEKVILELNTCNFGGFNDWRMPTIKELSSLVNCGTYNPAIDTNFFPNTISSYYWSSNKSVVVDYYGSWCVIFNNGDVYPSHSRNYNYIRFVRGEKAELSQKFIDNGDGTVTDVETGLMWQQDFSERINWEMALKYCETLNLAGYDDWRLPNRHELQSLLDYSLCYPAINTSFFPSTPSSYWWSSTTYIKNSSPYFSYGSAWTVYFGMGNVGQYDFKNYGRYVRAVRLGVPCSQNCPVIEMEESKIGHEGELLEFAVSATDLDGDTLIFAASNMPDGAIFDVSTGLFSWQPNYEQSGTYNVRFSVTDGDCIDCANVVINIFDTNRIPSAISSVLSTEEEVPLEINLEGCDLDEDPLSFMIVQYPSHGKLIGTAPSLQYLPSLNYNGLDSFQFKVNDGFEDSVIANVEITVNAVNDAPVLGTISDQTANEPAELEFTITATDLDVGDVLTYAWDFDNDGDYETTGQTVSHIWLDNGEYVVGLQVTDQFCATDTTTTTVSVLNVAPVVETITASVEPIEVGYGLVASAPFSDVGILDTHIATWDWGDDTTSEGVIVDYIVHGTHAYINPGVYTVTLTVEDDDGGVGCSVFQFVVVYDPEGGFVSGGGWIDSPEGAYLADLSLTGRANFGFVSRYKKGATVPTGNTEFQFKAGDLNFHSSTYDWLVVAGSKAMFKGVGTINGEGDYGFMLSAIDENLTSSTDVDLFRIKIWNRNDGGALIYDNLLDAEDDVDPTTQLQGGNIVIHK